MAKGFINGVMAVSIPDNGRTIKDMGMVSFSGLTGEYMKESSMMICSMEKVLYHFQMAENIQENGKTTNNQELASLVTIYHNYLKY